MLRFLVAAVQRRGLTQVLGPKCDIFAIGYRPMKVTRTVAHWLCTITFVIVGITALQGTAIVAFILSGTLTPGEPMFGGAATPSLAHALQFSLLGLVACALLGIARHKLGTSTFSTSSKGPSVGA